MTQRRVRLALIAVLVLILLVGAAFAFREFRANQNLAAACEDAASQRTSSASAREALEGGVRPTITVIGDSYSEALDIPAEHLDQTFPYLVGEQLGVSVHVDAVAGTGYINPGPCEGVDASYLERLDGGIDGDLVVVQGSVNDGGDPDALVERAIDTFEAIHDANPDAVIYALGPAPVPAFDREDVVAIDAAIREAAAAGGATHISMRDVELKVISDGVHPSNEGHAQIADVLASAACDDDRLALC